MEFPKRKLFFCDCGAKFDSPESAGAHAKACGSGGMKREFAYRVTAAAIKQLFNRLGDSDVTILFDHLARIEALRRRGVVRTETEVFRELLFESKPLIMRDDELNAARIDVAGWYGLSKQDRERAP